MLRAIIVGDRGQDGSILWDQLVARGYSLIGISRCHVRSHGFQWDAPVDIVDARDVRQLVNVFQPDQIFFLAAHHQSSEQPRTDSVDLWQRSWAVHVHAFNYILEAIHACQPHVRVFYASSSRVFGNVATAPQDEATPLRPACVYGVTKAAGMMLADFYRRERGLFVTCGVLFNHESPMRGPQFVSRRIVDGLLALKHGRAATLEIGALDARVDWGYAPDYTYAMQLMLDVSEPGTYVVASGTTHSVREMVTLAAEYLDVDWQGRVVETGRLLTRNPQQLCGNASRLRVATGWMPSVDFPQLVRILVDGALEREQRGAA